MVDMENVLNRNRGIEGTVEDCVAFFVGVKDRGMTESRRAATCISISESNSRIYVAGCCLAYDGLTIRLLGS